MANVGGSSRRFDCGEYEWESGDGKGWKRRYFDGDCGSDAGAVSWRCCAGGGDRGVSAWAGWRFRCSSDGGTYRTCNRHSYTSFRCVPVPRNGCGWLDVDLRTAEMKERRFKTRSEAGTLAMGERVAEMLLPAPKLIVLRGDLGAGKTTLVKGVAAALGAAEAEDVTSPTFTLVHEYVGSKVRLYHLDLYRLETERELLTLGLEEISEQLDALVLVEWGEKFPSIVGRADGEIAIEHAGGDERLFLMRVKG